MPLPAWTCMSAHVPQFPTCALTRLGSQALVRMILRMKRLPMHIVHSSRRRELSAGGVGWAEGISMDRIPRVDRSPRTGPLMARSDSARQEESIETTLV